MAACVMHVLLVVAAVAAAQTAAQTAAPVPLLRAYAHNDQEQGEPLVPALANGFCNVETDTNLLNGELIIGHDCLYPWSSCDTRLSDAYLTPLAKEFQANGGHILARAPKLAVCDEFTFVVDFKTSAAPSYEALATLLAEYDRLYPGLLTVFANDTVVSKGAVTVLVSGNRLSPAEMASQPRRHASLDGRIPENENDAWPSAVIGWLSQNWDSVFSSRATPFSEATCARIGEIAAKAHAKGQRIRFWNIPESEAFWAELVRCGVDVLNFDNYARASAWLLAGTMPAFYCEWCDIRLSHSSLGARKAHNTGFKHRMKVRDYMLEFAYTNYGIQVPFEELRANDRERDRDRDRERRGGRGGGGPRRGGPMGGGGGGFGGGGFGGPSPFPRFNMPAFAPPPFNPGGGPPGAPPSFPPPMSGGSFSAPPQYYAPPPQMQPPPQMHQQQQQPDAFRRNLNDVDAELEEVRRRRMMMG